MPSKFFEIDVAKLPKVEELEGRKLAYDKRSPEEYQSFVEPLPQIQQEMELGKTGKDILETPDGEAYKFFYDSEKGNRIKVDLDDNGDVSGYGDGRHRIEAARDAGVEYIPAEVSAPNQEVLSKVENQLGSGRDLSQYNPVAEANELQQVSSDQSTNRQPQDFSSNQLNNNQDSTPMYEKFGGNNRKETNQKRVDSLDSNAQNNIEQQHVEHPSGSEWVDDNAAFDNSQTTIDPPSERSYHDRYPEMKPEHANRLDRLLSGDYGQNSDSQETEPSADNSQNSESGVI